MAKISIANIRTELVVFLRNSDILSISTRGVATTTDEFNGNGSTTQFTLTNSNVKNVRSVTVDGGAKTFGTEYTVNYSTAVVTFTTAPGAGTNNVDIQYDYGTDKIWPDFPRDDLTIGSFPRVAIDIISMSSDAMGFGNDNVTSVLFTVVAYAIKTSTIDTIIDLVRSKFIDSHKSFYYLNKIKPQPVGPLLINPNKNQQILQRNIDFMSQHNFEVN